jgi:hypothetical protein
MDSVGVLRFENQQAMQNADDHGPVHLFEATTTDMSMFIRCCIAQ